jgi:hypothetical protein
MRARPRADLPAWSALCEVFCAYLVSPLDAKYFSENGRHRSPAKDSQAVPTFGEPQIQSKVPRLLRPRVLPSGDVWPE